MFRRPGTFFSVISTEVENGASGSSDMDCVAAREAESELGCERIKSLTLSAPFKKLSDDSAFRVSHPRPFGKAERLDVGLPIALSPVLP